MFSFGEKYKEIKDYPDTWALGQSILNDKPIFLRFREGLKSAVGHPQYPYQIGVAIPLLHPTKDGLTIDSEATALGVIEDSLVKVLQEERGVFALVITYDGMREFVFYMKEWKPEYLEQKVKSIDRGLHKPNFMMQNDPQWNTFKKFTPH